MTEAKKPKAKWWYVAATIAAFVISGAVARTCTQSTLESGRRVLTPQSEVEAQLDRYADSDPVMSLFRDSFPQEWSTFRAATAADAKSSISMIEMKEGAATRMRAFMIEHSSWTTAAPIADLNALLSAEREFVDQLASDDRALCAQYGMSGLRGSEDLSSEAVRLAMEVFRTKVIATQRGRDSPYIYGAITPEDADQMVTGMAKVGASEDVIDLMLSDASVGSAYQQCAGTQALYRSVDAMPDAQAARVYATILQGATAEQNAQQP